MSTFYVRLKLKKKKFFLMPKGKYLNNHEKGQIDALLNLKYSVYDISQK